VFAATPGDSVVVVYNPRQAESKAVAQHYATKRKVPPAQVVALPLPTVDAMTRAEFRGQLQEPLLKALADRRLLVFGESNRVTSASVRAVVLCFGVPLKILRDTGAIEADTEKLPAPMRRNEAAVDSELALLPLARGGHRLTGPLANPSFAATNVSLLHPTNGVLVVARLDGPTVDIARGLVDKALQAEAEGLWGRAWFDARGLKSGDYLPGDEWIRSAARTARRFGFETVLDEAPGTFPAGTPLSHVALYAGWYDANVSGPFARAQVEFVPGAIAYHLHSFSAPTLRAVSDHWCGPLLARGATATMGSVDEPYLAGTPDLGVFFDRLLDGGFSFGEAALASQGSLSWQTTVVGDPLYRPFGMHPRERHEQLTSRGSGLIEWSHLLVVNRNLARGTSAAEMAGYLEAVKETRGSAVLIEKLADLYEAQGKPSSAADTTALALRQSPSPQQRIRLLLALAARREALKDDAAAVDALKQLLAAAPDYPGRRAVLERLVALAEKLGQPAEAAKWRDQLRAP
jgi:uncharacterized protein (TIGR03790 family)